MNDNLIEMSHSQMGKKQNQSVDELLFENLRCKIVLNGLHY